MIEAPVQKAVISPDGEVSRVKTTMRPCKEEDLEKVSETLHLAFSEYPYEQYILGHLDKDVREQGHLQFMQSVVRNALATGNMLINDDCTAVGAWWYGDIDVDNEAAARAIGPPGGDKLIAVEKALEELWNTDQPIARLCFVAVHPEHQRKGYGKVLLTEIIRRIEEYGKGQLPIHLHTEVAGNVEIYKKFGFEVVAEYRTPEDDLTFWIMIRKPQL